ncbi:hypothetical protein BGZ60DRAFT_564525 [Tricladium varicosporioides]|nr:hypothetical protein BGZ60DRAFT_564525 [Hymenoscyphus varicosporioides]
MPGPHSSNLASKMNPRVDSNNSQSFPLSGSAAYANSRTNVGLNAEYHNANMGSDVGHTRSGLTGKPFLTSSARCSWYEQFLRPRSKQCCHIKLIMPIFLTQTSTLIFQEPKMQSDIPLIMVMEPNKLIETILSKQATPEVPMPLELVIKTMGTSRHSSSFNTGLNSSEPRGLSEADFDQYGWLIGGAHNVDSSVEVRDALRGEEVRNKIA